MDRIRNLTHVRTVDRIDAQWRVPDGYLTSVCSDVFSGGGVGVGGVGGGSSSSSGGGGGGGCSSSDSLSSLFSSSSAAF